MKLFSVIASSFFVMITSVGLGQIVVQNIQSPSNLVQNVLLGTGVTATNITYNGSAVNAQNVQSNVTFFNASSTSFPISSGVLLTTGNGTGAVGPNNSGSFTLNTPATPLVTSDPDLNTIANGSVTNGAVLEFDFIPTGDTISFRYVFASDEYPEFSPSSYNDAFGFFLSGPNPLGGNYTSTNLALIPGTSTPVTINNVGPGGAQNPAYYVNNVSGAAYGTAVQYDGTTVVLISKAPVICGQTYHIKLAICNVGDQAYDSGVFLEAESFSSDAVDVTVATVSGDTTVIENCTDAQFIFTRPVTATGDTLIVNYTIAGTATQGTDYNNLTNPITFLPGEDSVVLTLTPFADGLTEGPETVIITVYTISPCGDTIVTVGTLVILDQFTIPVTGTDKLVLCANDSVLVSATASGGFPPYTFTWNYLSQQNDTAYVPITQNGTLPYVVNVVDQCGNTGLDTVLVTMNQTLQIDTMITYLASACTPDGAVSGQGSGITGTPAYHWQGPGANGPNQINATVLQNIGPGWYYFSITDNVCSVNDSIFLGSDPAPNAIITPSSTFGCNPYTVTFTNGSQNATSYTWEFGVGDVVNTTNTDSQTRTYTTDDQVMLIAINGPCRDTTYATITISNCGCTDANAVNYDPNATTDDGSCEFPEPIAIIPNIFTPNGDKENDVFMLTTYNTIEVTLIINNRWGNRVFEATGAAPFWDGKVNGNPAVEGIYFLQYTLKGLKDKEVKGQGFIQLVK